MISTQTTHPDMMPSDVQYAGHGRRPREVRMAYDAAGDSNRRRAHPTTGKSEDEVLKPADRRKVVGGTRDAARNQVLLSWMVRKYLDFVSGFNPKFKTADKGLNRDLKQWAAERSKADNFDVRGVHDRRRATRLAEARRLLDGDFGLLKLRSRHVQAIETDRVRQPDPSKLKDRKQISEWSHGVRTNGSGKPTFYAVHSRQGNGYDFERFVRADRMIWHSCHESHFRFDQTRGVSPITAALNELADFYESKEFARAKLKLSQALGLVIYSESGQGVGNHTVTGAGADSETVEGDETYDVNLGGAPWKLELNDADRAELLESKTPATETVQFLNFCALVFMKALDLPYSYFREDFTNFFGSKIATVLMLMAARSKRSDICQMLGNWLEFQLRFAVLPEFGEIVLPASMEVEDVLRSCSWIPDGMPWFDRSREVKPALQAIAGGIESYSNIVAQLHGMDLDDWLDLIEDEQAEIEGRNIRLVNYDKAEALFADDADMLVTDDAKENV